MTSVVIAIGPEQWEPELVTCLVAPSSGVHVARRCVDAVDLAAVALGGHAVAAIVGPRLPRLDRTVIERLRASGVALIGVHAAGDDVSASRLRGLGLAAVVSLDPNDVTMSALTLARIAGELRLASTEPSDVLAEPHSGAVTHAGSVTVILGPAGAPGRSTIALNLATCAAQSGFDTLLVDADHEAPALASTVGILVDRSGISQVMRRLDDGLESAAAIDNLTVPLQPHLRLISGAAPMAASDFRPAAVGRLIEALAAHAEYVVLDTASWRPVLSTPELGRTWHDALVAHADQIVIVGAADPIGLVRLFALLTWVEAAAPQARHLLILNRVRQSALGGADLEITRLLGDLVKLPERFSVVNDPAASDLAMLRAEPVLCVAPRSRVAAQLRQASLAAMSDITRVASANPDTLSPRVRRVAHRLPSALRRTG